MIDRLSIRTRPSGWPVMYQTWGKLLFLHWPVAAELLQPLIASGLRASPSAPKERSKNR